ncbi:5'-nucleotidase [Flavobacterium sp.]|uniref:5'-nucleotidase n=1 Tax=Flavobacterium sp. TaxID=239 RepID=UPI002A82E16A|nr:5'-nucleotidase [Flavobacterium sp.]
MVKVKKIKIYLYNFVILLTLSMLLACSSKKYNNYQTSAALLNINDTILLDSKIQKFVNPFKEHINRDLDSVLAYNPITQDKSKGQWETNIGNLFSNVTLELTRPIFKKRENKTIDFCLLNHGGIRAIIPAGNVTSRTAYEIMPFENSVVVIGLTGKEVLELANYVLTEKKPHPLEGIVIKVNEDYSKVLSIKINNIDLDENKIYYVATSDYLGNGGDNMIFFKNSTIKYDLDYKLRNLFIDYFKKVDTIPNITTKHIITE